MVHHADRGVQYRCRDYIVRRERHWFRISMSHCGHTYDNARAERFMKTLKCEEVDNRHRLHSALGYRTLLGFDQALPAAAGGLA